MLAPGQVQRERQESGELGAASFMEVIEVKRGHKNGALIHTISVPRPGMSGPQRQLTSLAAPGVPAPAPCFPGLHAGHEQQMVSLGDPQRPCGLTGGACLGSQRRGDPAGDREAG